MKAANDMRNIIFRKIIAKFMKLFKIINPEIIFLNFFRINKYISILSVSILILRLFFKDLGSYITTTSIISLNNKRLG